jgi:hypothetical protein
LKLPESQGMPVHSRHTLWIRHYYHVPLSNLKLPIITYLSLIITMLKQIMLLNTCGLVVLIPSTPNFWHYSSHEMTSTAGSESLCWRGKHCSLWRFNPYAGELRHVTMGNQSMASSELLVCYSAWLCLGPHGSKANTELTVAPLYFWIQ